MVDVKDDGDVNASEYNEPVSSISHKLTDYKFRGHFGVSNFTKIHYRERLCFKTRDGKTNLSVICVTVPCMKNVVGVIW
jgi:hypothetical protein